MLFLDIETLGTESTSVVLSVAMTVYKDNAPVTYQSFIDNGIFVKFDAKEQINRYKRVTEQHTLEWWSKQCDFAKKRSLVPSSEDVSAEQGIDQLNEWLRKIPNYKNMLCWTRGSLDQVCIDSLCNSIGKPKIIPYYNYRDVRTLIECFYPKQERGYVEVDKSKCPDYDFGKVIKHDPLHDVAYDAVMILAGV